VSEHKPAERFDFCRRAVKAISDGLMSEEEKKRFRPLDKREMIE
jgi:hypothetical protein